MSILFKTVVFSLFISLAFFACKKSNKDTGEATITFINSTGATARIQVSATDANDFTNPLLDFSLANGAQVVKMIPAGARWIKFVESSISIRVVYEADEKKTVYVTTASASDARYKKDVSYLGSRETLHRLQLLKPASYRYISDDFGHLAGSNGYTDGFIAQEAEQVFPEIVSSNASGYRSINYIALIPVLTAAIQEQQHQIDQLRQTIAEMKSEKGSIQQIR